MSRRVLPNIGDRYGYYEIISNEIQVDKSNKSKFLVRCKCGKEKWLCSHYLKTYDNPRCLSCRAVETNKNAVKTRLKNGTLHKGFGEIPKTFASSYRHQAKKRGIWWDISITPEYLWNLYLRQDKKCAISGIDINFKQELKDGKYDFLNANCSLDRINSSIGYTLNNIQWVHKDINNMKMHFNQDYFIKLCKYVAEKN